MPRPTRPYHRQEWHTVVAAEIGDAFAFLADPRSTALLAPSWADARHIEGPSRDLGLGSEREYVVRWFGWPLYLRVRVTGFAPPTRFVLEQVQGPWHGFRHVFTLRPAAGGTAVDVHDEFFESPGLIQRITHRILVARQLRDVGAYRHAALHRHLGVGGTHTVAGED